MTRDELDAMSQEELDDIVHDMKAAEAASINNAGREAQMEYILRQG